MYEIVCDGTVGTKWVHIKEFKIQKKEIHNSKKLTAFLKKLHVPGNHNIRETLPPLASGGEQICYQGYTVQLEKESVFIFYRINPSERYPRIDGFENAATAEVFQFLRQSEFYFDRAIEVVRFYYARYRQNWKGLLVPPQYKLLKMCKRAQKCGHLRLQAPGQLSLLEGSNDILPPHAAWPLINFNQIVYRLRAIQQEIDGRS